MPTSYDFASLNIRKTWIYLTGFFVFVIGVGWLFSYLLDNYIILVIALIFAFLQSFLSYWYSDKIVLNMARARLVEKKDNPELYRIVENLCIAAGLPMPRIYVMKERQPNAFATGRDPEHSAVVVTQGLLDRLERKELEGVISHELSHIKNRDTLLGTIVVVLVGVIVFLSDFFLRISFWGAGDRDSRNSNALLIVLAILASILAPIAATLIQLAISRKREFLADASGALLTRYPEGLAQALEKISQDRTPMRFARNSTAHLFIESPLRGRQSKSWLAKLFMTHPPVEERIRALRQMNL
ncbi:MAG TPA: zinc metalloprotease HtpX [Candidatus Parcubacteria bacterium]|nr:zinc metalloprotease HtpX [Candidatus Parcubacteria bacterium]